MSVTALKQEQGFTLVELVIILMLLGILAAIALPKLANLKERAQLDSARTVASALSQAVSVAHKQWVAAGHPPAGTISLTNGIVVQPQTNTLPKGYPYSAASIGNTPAHSAVSPTAATCLTIWQHLMLNPPQAFASPEICPTDSNQEMCYQVVAGGSGITSLCSYQQFDAGAATGVANITYNPVTGVVTSP